MGGSYPPLHTVSAGHMLFSNHSCHPIMLFYRISTKAQKVCFICFVVKSMMNQNPRQVSIPNRIS
jgi:hypothetical protein